MIQYNYAEETNLSSFIYPNIIFNLLFNYAR